MSLDALVTNPGRLRILTSLVASPSQEFVQLRQATQLTDGNLSTHAHRLRQAGFLAIDKTFRAGKPVTTITLTLQGRRALESHVHGLMRAISPASVAPPPAAAATAEREMTLEDDWVD